MKFVLIFILVIGMSSCTHLQKSRRPATIADGFTITIPKTEFVSSGSERSEQRMKEGEAWTLWNRFIIDETDRQIDSKTWMSCVLEYFGNKEALMMKEGTELTFSSVSPPRDHILPSGRGRPRLKLEDSVSKSAIGLVFTLGTNQTLTLLCEKYVINLEQSKDPSLPIVIDDVLASYSNLRVAETDGTEGGSDDHSIGK